MLNYRNIETTKRMKKLMTLALFAIMAVGAQAAEKADSIKKSNKPVFTTIKENPITRIKDQNRSGTCWDYSTLSFFESEILKATGKRYNLCEAFVANKTYMERAIQVVRYHGDCQFAQGGSAEDVLSTLKNHGICPLEAMPFPGSLYGDSLNNFNEFFSLLEPYVAAISKSSAKKISNQWKVGMQGILDAYLGKCPEEFTYEGKKYTPKSFMESLKINLDDYVSITSYTHHPFYTAFAVEVQDNWRFPLSYNVPMDEMMQIIDNAIANGYTVAWGGDVSEDGFTRQGLAYAVDAKATQNLQGSDMAKWLKMTATKKRSIIGNRCRQCVMVCSIGGKKVLKVDSEKSMSFINFDSEPYPIVVQDTFRIALSSEPFNDGMLQPYAALILEKK